MKEKMQLTFDTIAEMGKTHPYFHIAVKDGLKHTTYTPSGRGVSDEPITHQFMLGCWPALELTVEPLAPEELAKMEELDLGKTRITGDLGTNKIVRRTPVDGLRVTADYPNRKETYARVRHHDEKLDVFIVPLSKQDLREMASSDGKVPRGGFMVEFDYSGGPRDRKFLTY